MADARILSLLHIRPGLLQSGRHLARLLNRHGVVGDTVEDLDQRHRG